MGIVNLTQRQINLLHTLVEHQRNGRLMEPFGLVPINLSEYVIYIRQQSSMRVRNHDDLDVLSLHGYLDYDWNRLSNAKVYSVTKLAQLVFKSGELIVHAEKPVPLPPAPPKNSHLSPENQEYMLLLVETDRMRGLLKMEITAVLCGADLGDAVGELTAVQDLYYMVRPETAVIAQTLQQIGERLIAQLSAAKRGEHAAVAQALATFGTWTRLIFQLTHKA